MQLFIKQQVFTLAPKFTVKDEAGNDRYFVQGQFLSMRSQMQVFNAAGQEVAQLYRRLFTFFARYILEIGGVQAAEIVKEITFFKPRYFIEGTDLRVEGDFFAHEYTLFYRDVPIMHLSKEWFTWGDSYMLDIYDERYELLALGVVLAIDCVNASQRN